MNKIDTNTQIALGGIFIASLIFLIIYCISSFDVDKHKYSKWIELEKMTYEINNKFQDDINLHHIDKILMSTSYRKGLNTLIFMKYHLKNGETKKITYSSFDGITDGHDLDFGDTYVFSIYKSKFLSKHDITENIGFTYFSLYYLNSISSIFSQLNEIQENKENNKISWKIKEEIKND